MGILLRRKQRLQEPEEPAAERSQAADPGCAEPPCSALGHPQEEDTEPSFSTF